MKKRLAARVGKPETDLVISNIDEYRAVVEQREVVEKAIKLSQVFFYFIYFLCLGWMIWRSPTSRVP